MFYSQFILAKKGPLGTIWIAAHLERKLRKNQVADTDIGVSVDSILCPDVPIALRLSSHLLLGVVRIYSRKVNYLFDDCSEALLKVKQAFRSAAVDLPPEQSKAPYHSITLPETFDLDDFELPDNEIFQGNDRHVSTREQITLQDTMDGAAFPSLQFGLDERFGDGDASQIGLDLEEDLFMEKGNAAGTTDSLNNIDAEQSPAKPASSFKDEHKERVSDVPLDSSSNYFSFQAPSTPGLMEEPNLPSVQEALVNGDDHMDEEHDIPELVTKEVSGNANFHHLDEQENEQVKKDMCILPNEPDEPTSHDNAQTLKSVAHIEAISSVENLGILQNDGIMAADSHSIGEHYAHDEAVLNRSENAIFTEVLDPDTYADGGKAELNGSYLPDSNNKPEVAKDVTSFEETETILVNNGYQCQKSDQPCEDLKNPETSDYNGSGKSAVFCTPMLKPCNSHDNSGGVEKLPDASRISAEGDGLCSLVLSSKQDATNAVEISTDDHELTMPTLNEDQITHEGVGIISNLDKPLENDSLGEDHLQNENNSKVSDFSAPEKLLSMPNLPAGQPDNVLIECTPGVDFVAGDGDASFENLLSGKKRSYTESTLTIQSLNSAASSGAAQSKHSMELVPEDDDLLSSILGGRSTTFKLKPTPPVAETLPAKRQRTSIRASAQKRKVLMDDSMVLHGDMIREQLTNTEDIRRVRKKAPCTHLEVWVLQKQFLGDDIFGEPLFTGLLPEFRYLHDQAFDLSGIKIIHDDGSKGKNETNDKGRQVHDGLEETPSTYESAVVVDALQKELETFDNEIAKQMSKHDETVKKPETGNDNQVGGVGNKAVASEDIDSSRQPINQDCLTEFTREDSSAMEELSGSGRQHHGEINANVDGKCDGKSSLEEREGVASADGKSSLDGREGGVSANTTAVIWDDVHGRCSSPVSNNPASDCVDLEGRASPTSDRIMEECTPMAEPRVEVVEVSASEIRLDDSCPASNIFLDLEGRASPTSDMVVEECRMGEPRFENAEEAIASDIRYDDNFPPFNNFPEEEMKLDPSPVVETGLSSHDTRLSEKEDLPSLETEPMLATDPITIPTEVINPAEHSEFEAEFFEHDTDFLNVDDDDVAEDYEDDVPNPEEKRMLDNSGWSSRTRSVANYLQVLFVKDTHHAKKVIPLESLLAGKTRKEASRMFFETLVLKTKDYIDAAQEGPFCDIKIKPTGKLMKSEF